MVGFKTIINQDSGEFDSEVSEFLSGLMGDFKITFHPVMNESERFIMYIAHIIY